MNVVGDHQVISVTSEDVRPIRREVLRIGMPRATVDFDGDDEPSTFHLAVVDASGAILAISTWMSRPFADDPEVAAMQLRGMATRGLRQRSGLGTLLIDAGFERARARTVGTVWANARDSALEFYLKHGFEVVGEGFVEHVTKLPHHRVRIDL